MAKVPWLNDTVRDSNLYNHPPVTIAPDKSLATAYGKMYDNRTQHLRFRHLIVTNGGKVNGNFEGIISYGNFTLKTDINTIMLHHSHVSEAMTPASKTVSVGLDDTIETVVKHFVTKIGQHRHYIGLLPVREDKNPNVIYAVISYVDILSRIKQGSFEVPSTTVAEIPYAKYPPESGKHFYHATPDTEFAEINFFFENEGIRTIPVIDGNTIVGLVTDRKFLDCIMRFSEDERFALKATDEYLMIPREELRLVKTTDFIKDICGMLLEGDKPDALLVSDDNSSLKGIMSYVDVLRFFLED